MKLEYQNEVIWAEGKWNVSLLKREKWLYYLCLTQNNATNVERVEAISEITGFETVQYVLRTLKILEGYKDRLSEYMYDILSNVLQWSEVAKGGLEVQRDYWMKQGFPLEIHNLASAEIFLQESDSMQLSQNDKQLIYILIQTHGIIGQNIRGEVSVCRNQPLLSLITDGLVTAQELSDLLYCLNHCVIGGVSDALWKNVSTKVSELISSITAGRLTEYPAHDRIQALCPAFQEVTKEEEKFFAQKVFLQYELWFFESALKDFSPSQIMEILHRILETPQADTAKHITFKPLADTLYYDYEGKKHINIYKKRIFEKYLKDDASQDVKMSVKIVNQTMYVNVVFSRVCEKLIEFCVEAERCGLLTYEKSITVLFDMFGFRKDEFDRLNNEDKYLQTMNDSQESTKGSIADYIVGNSIVDVGSGGGIMLDLLESKYPDKEIIGTDISANVIETLEDKRMKERHHWKVVKHNFVEGAFEQKVDTVIFSSILHEVFSYTETKNGRFDIETVYEALHNAYDSLNTGGRIVIRDGIKTSRYKNEEQNLLRVKFLTREGIVFFKNYVKDFKGLPDVTKNRPLIIDEKENYAVGDLNFMREFLYTYTWGNESYSHEVQEQFGYLTLDEYRSFFERTGAKVIEARQFLEPGYEQHLSSLVQLYDAKGTKTVTYPDSNCIVVVEKQ